MSSSPRRPSLFVLTGLGAAAVLAAAACGEPKPATQPPNGSDTPEPASSGAASAAPSATEPGPATPTPAATADASAMPIGCRLPAPKRSDDACKTDADCGVSDPCHAHACVAKAKSHPPDKSTVCTRQMDCFSADANPCGCLDGMCALIPAN